MGQRTIIMHPTVEKAKQNWFAVCRIYKLLIKEAKRNPLSVKFVNGDTWYFRAKTEGARAYRGYHAEMVCIDDFPLDEKMAKFLQRSRKMTMSIDKAISHLYTYSSTMGSGQTTQEQHEESKRVAIDVMRKYQKIQEIMDELNGNFYESYLKDRQALEKIYEVVEDGNIDR